MDRFYCPELDSLRFVAFFLVFAFHTCAPILAPDSIVYMLTAGGAYGVDLFFLLSAYLITELFRRERLRYKSIDIVGFYWRRLLRIWPLYFSFIAAVLAASYVVPRIQMPLGATTALLVFCGNWYLVSYPFFSPAGILWSVSIEEQFYICAPWAVRFLSPRSLAVGAAGLIGCAILSRLVVTGQATWYATVTRLDPIATGALLALALSGRTLNLGLCSRVGLGTLGLAALYVAAVWFHGNEPRSVLEASVAYPLANLGAVSLFLTFLGSSVTWAPLVYLGRISYGLYVFHLLTLDVTKVGLDRAIGICPWWLRGAIALPLTIILAAASYRWLEARFLLRKTAFGRSVGRLSAVSRTAAVGR